MGRNIDKTLKISGVSFDNGIIFYTKKTRVKATRGKDGVIDINNIPKKNSKIRKQINNIPLLRGLLFSLSSNILLASILIIVLIAEITGILTKNSTLSNTEMKLVPAFMISLIFIILYLLYSQYAKSSWLQYHGAEHKIIHAYDNTGKTDIEAISKESCLHRMCGTVYAILLFPLFVMFYCLTRYITLSYVLASIIATEIHGLKNPLETPLIKYIFQFSLFIQRIMVKEPDDEHIEVGIACIEELISKEDYNETHSF